MIANSYQGERNAERENALRRVNRSEVEFHGASMCGCRSEMDERKIENPTRADIHHTDIVYPGFGAGIHRCAGSRLDRLELRVLFEEVFKRLPEFCMVDDDGLKF